MEESATVQCPYCGQNCEVGLDAMVSRQEFTTDCEVCCRPFTVRAECEGGEVLSVDTSAE